ncbi:MAG: hypothetical protein FWG63_02105 [Defluviitaleaceae bacterium]|nr:hypothetical protein [Defluviitaleaceae bacterium]
MKKFIGKIKKTRIITHALIFAIFTTFAVVSAQEVWAREFTLTVEEAAFRATQRSRELRTLAEDAHLARLNLDFLRNQQSHSHFNTITEFVTAQANVMAVAATRASYLHSANAHRDTLSFLVANYFASILAAEMELILYDYQLAIMVQEQAILETMVTIGVASPLEYQMALLALENATLNRQSLVNAVNNAHTELNRIIGTPQNRVHRLIFEVEYAPLAVVNLTPHIHHQRLGHALVLEAQANVNVYRYRLDHHRVELDPHTGLPAIGQITREELTIFVNQAARDLADTRNRVEAHVVDTYHQIRLLEQNIETMYLQLQDMYINREVLKAQLVAGEVVPLDIERQDLDIRRLEENLRRIKTDHYLLLMQFNNPNIAF